MEGKDRGGKEKREEWRKDRDLGKGKGRGKEEKIERVRELGKGKGRGKE